MKYTRYIAFGRYALRLQWGKLRYLSVRFYRQSTLNQLVGTYCRVQSEITQADIDRANELIKEHGWSELRNDMD